MPITNTILDNSNSSIRHCAGGAIEKLNAKLQKQQAAGPSTA